MLYSDLSDENTLTKSSVLVAIKLRRLQSPEMILKCTTLVCDISPSSCRGESIVSQEAIGVVCMDVVTACHLVEASEMAPIR